jgi:oligosaccharide repeat unit polymerase
MSILTPNMLSITFYYSLFASSFIGSLLIVLNIDNHYMVKLISDDVYRVIGFFVISFVMIIIPLTMYLVSTLFGFQPEKEYHQYLDATVHIDEDEDKYVYFMFLGLTVLSVLSIVYTIVHLKQIPIIELFKGSDNLGQLRIEASRNFGGNTVIRNVLGVALTPILSMITFTYFYKTRQIKWLALFVITFPGAIFMQIYDLSKAPVFFYMLMFILLLIYLKIIKLTWFRVILLGVVGCAGLVVMYIYIQGVTDIEQFLSYNRGPIGRLILSQVAPLYLHLDLFTNRMPLLMGQSLPSSMLGLYDIEQIRSARLAMEVFFPERVEEGTAGVLNTLFAAEAYANFGYLGVVLGTLYVGALIQIIYIIFLRLPKSPLFVSLFVFFTVNIPRVVIGGFVDFLFNTLWIAILVILLSPYLAIYFFRIFMKNRKMLHDIKQN